jgi:ABC-type spermidine/putrescine transport system permease subunit II
VGLSAFLGRTVEETGCKDRRRQPLPHVYQLILPLIRPVLAVTGLLVFVAVIGECILASIFLTDNGVK